MMAAKDGRVRIQSAQGYWLAAQYPAGFATDPHDAATWDRSQAERLTAHIKGVQLHPIDDPEEDMTRKGRNPNP